MKNVKELRNELADNFDRLKKGDMNVSEAAQMNSAADKIIKTVMVELKHIELTSSRQRIPFLMYDGKEELPSNGANQLHAKNSGNQ